MDDQQKADHGQAGPQRTDPESTGAEGTGPKITGSKITGSKITGPEITGPKITGPEITRSPSAGSENAAADLTAPEIPAAGDPRPFRRRVFYIPGYDPIHPRRYRELYRKEAAAQAAISGYQISLRPKARKGGYGWRVGALIDGKESEAEIEVLLWSDIVRSSMGQSIWQSYLQLIRTAWIYIASGALFRLMRLRKGPVIAALYPVVMLLLQLALALLAASAVAALVATLSEAVLETLLAMLAMLARPVTGPVTGLMTSASGDGASWWISSPAAGLALVLGLVAGGAAAVAVLRWFKARDGKIFAYYLMHDYAHSASCKGATPPELSPRLAAFRTEIRAALEQEDLDEVLVVGHSSGAHLGVQVLADLLRRGLPQSRAALAFLSLGQVVPMVSFLPKADALRRDLHQLAQEPRLTWLDVTAPGDGCAFALCDPVAVSGVAPARQIWPLVISAAFRQTLSEARWAALKRRYFRLHFQYLCAFDRPKDYDYFRITAGALTLADRFEGRAPSKSRITKPVNGYVSMADDPR